MSESRGAETRPGRIWVIIGLALALTFLLIGIVNISTREPEADYQKVAGTVETQRVFGGVRQEADRLGDPDAPIVMQVFLDAQDANSRDQYLDTIPALVTSHVRTGELQMLLRNRSLTINATELAFYGIEAAANQDYGWQFNDLMFRNQETAKENGKVDAGFLRLLAESIEPLDLEQWQADFDAGIEKGSKMNASLEEQDTLAIKLGIRAKPAVVLTGPGGTEVVQDAPDLAQIEAAIDKVS